MKKKSGKRLLFAAGTLAVAVISLLLMSRIPFIFTVNDDLFMKNIVSGAYLVRPDFHAVYMEVPLCMLLSLLYAVSAAVPWYGICFFLFHCFSWGSILYRIGRKTKNRNQRIAATLLILLIFTSCGFYHIASIQFTVTAAILGAAALVWFYTADFSLPLSRLLTDQCVTAVFVFLSLNVRRNVLLMLIPIAGMLWLAVWMSQEGRFGKETVLKFCGTAAICIGAVAVTLISYRIAYGSEEWKQYIRYNDNATVLYDYYEWPDFEENRELYEELGISYEGYYGAKEAYFLSVDSGIDAAAMEKLAERSNELHRNRNSFGSRMIHAAGNILERSYTETDRPLNLVVMALYGLTLLLALLYRRNRALYMLGALLAGRLFSWFYVVYEGRFPVRITQSLYLAEAAVLLAILLIECMPAAHRKGQIQIWLVRLLFAGFGVGLLYFSAVRIRHVAAENAWRVEESRDLQDVKEYCREHAENFYFLDSKSITNDTEKIFDSAGSRFENYIVFGGWLSDSPVFQQKLELAGIMDVEEALLQSGRVYVIFEDEERCPTDYVELYFDSKYPGFEIKKTEQFGRDKDQFSVYQLTAKE